MYFNMISIAQRSCTSQMRPPAYSEVQLLLARAKTASAPMHTQHVIGLIDDPPFNLQA